MERMGMFTRAERRALTAGVKVGDVVVPPRFPLVEDAFRITRRADVPQAWFVLYIDPSQRSAERVELFVERRGFETFWPRAKRLQRVKLRKNGLKTNGRYHPFEHRTVTAPVLPRYMLVAMPAACPAFDALDCDEGRFHGVVGFVATETGPLVIPDIDVAGLMHRELNGEWDDTVQKGRKRVARTPEWCEPGRTVRITEGPFAMFNAIVETHIGQGRVTATAGIFGRATRIDLGLDQIEALCT